MKNNCLYDEIHPVHRLAFVFDCQTYCQNCRDCLQFCFMHIIQQELDSIKREWNTHRIRVSKDRLVSAGIPEEFFFLPQVHGMTCDLITHAGTRDLTFLQQTTRTCKWPRIMLKSQILLHPCFFFWQLSSLAAFPAFPQNIHEAICLYVELVTLYQ